MSRHFNRLGRTVERLEGYQQLDSLERLPSENTLHLGVLARGRSTTAVAERPRRKSRSKKFQTILFLH